MSSCDCCICINRTPISEVLYCQNRKLVSKSSKRNLKHEYYVLNALKTSGLTPKPYRFEKGVLETEYVEGNHVSLSINHLNTYKKIQRFFPNTEVYLATNDSKYLKDKFIKKLDSISMLGTQLGLSGNVFKIMEKLLVQNISSIDKLPFSLCHGDLHKGNVVVDYNGRIVFIDWEDACIAPQTFGYSCFFNSFFEFSEYCLNHFGESLAGQVLRAEVVYLITRKLMFVDDFIWFGHEAVFKEKFSINFCYGIEEMIRKVQSEFKYRHL